MKKQPTTPLALIVDDEEPIQKLVDYNFQRSGFVTEIVDNGYEAYERIKKAPKRYDIVILDIMLPGMDGMDVCKRLRQEQIDVPVILLTARDEEIDRIVGLEIGADDYVTKPFSPRELVARARAVLRRMDTHGADAALTEKKPQDEILSVGEVVMDVGRHEVSVRGQQIALTPKEFELLRYFLLNAERVLSRDQLLDQVWGYSSANDTRIVDIHVSHLREKIESDPKRPVHLLTVRGIGYKFSQNTNGSFTQT